MAGVASCSQMRGVPRRIVIATVGAFSKLVTSVLNSTTVHNKSILLDLVESRPPGVPLLTVSNHMSTLDDPLLWGFQGFPITNAKLARWVLAAEDICFTNAVFSCFFRLGKCIPIKRNGGIYQPSMIEALEKINDGEWVHTFPEGKVCQDEVGPMRRWKWGIGSLIARASVPPVVLPIAHSGFEKVMPEKYFLGRRPIFPLCRKSISIVIGDPVQFDLSHLKQMAKSLSTNSKLPTFSELHPCMVPCNPFELKLIRNRNQDHEACSFDESARRWVYAQITRLIQGVVEDLRAKARTLNQGMNK